MTTRIAPRTMGVLITAAGTLSQLAVLAIIVFSTLLAPPWAVVVGVTVWLASLAPFVRAARSRRWATLVVPLAVLAAWVAFLTFGDLALGWTA